MTQSNDNEAQPPQKSFETLQSGRAPPFEAQPPQMSFETVQSGRAPSVFSLDEKGKADAASAGTSMMDSGSQDSQGLHLTQEFDAFMEDDQIRKSFTEMDQSPRSIDAILQQNPPFRIRSILPSETPFWQSWEIHRAADHLSMLPKVLNEMVMKRMISAKTQSFSNSLRSIVVEHDNQNVPPRSELLDWMIVSNQYYNEQSNKVVSFKGRLEWSKDASKGLFDFALDPLRSDQSCRFQRKFGADRFLVISSPVLSECPLSKAETRSDKQTVHNAISKWLAATPHYVAGRYWRVVYVDQDKPKKKRKEQKEIPRLKFFLFAQSGLGIEPTILRDPRLLNPSQNLQHCETKIGDLLEWHMPMSANKDSTDLKLFSRLGLGYSKTVPTIPLKPCQFISVPDSLGSPGSDGSRQVMNDGCALMSLAYAQAIWKKCGATNIHEVPSVVQGRISGAKGLWIVDYENKYSDQGFENDFWIEVSDSQLKIKPHPAERHDADETQRTFEVLKHSSATKEGHLNLQLITILENGGVPRQVLQDALVADTSNFSVSLMEAMHSREALRMWIKEYSPGPRVGNTNMLGSFPSDRADQVNQLLDAGFEPEHNAMVVEACQRILSNYLTDYVERLRIKVPHSTVVYCAPDPLGILKPGQVHLGFSRPVVDPRTGVYESSLIDLKVLVARNPAYLASDIQLQTAVYENKLRHYKDVILFSTQGETPLASLLSGGDYDGDSVTVLWDPEIVRHFQNVPKVPRLATEKECHLRNKSRLVSSIFRSGSTPTDEEWVDLLQGCIQFNSGSNMMGKCSSEYEKLVYSLSVNRVQSKLSHPGVLALAALAGYLVDANKQGWLLEENAWHSLRKAASGPLHLEIPAYKDLTVSPNYNNVIDFLKFSVAKDQMHKANGAFSAAHSTNKKYDHDLSALWNKYVQIASTEVMKDSSLSNHSRAGHQGPNTLRKILCDGKQSLFERVKQIDEMWRNHKSRNNNNNSSFYKDKVQSENFTAMIGIVHEPFQAIEPPALVHWICDLHRYEKMESYSLWSLLRASCLYYELSRRGAHYSWIWHVAGHELCFLKDRKRGTLRVVRDDMYSMLKIDMKHSRRLLEKREEFVDESSGSPGEDLEKDDGDHEN